MGPLLVCVLQRCQTHCQLEVHLHYSKLGSHPSEGQWAKMAPFRILSVDIECQGRKVGRAGLATKQAACHALCLLPVCRSTLCLLASKTCHE